MLYHHSSDMAKTFRKHARLLYAMHNQFLPLILHLRGRIWSCLKTGQGALDTIWCDEDYHRFTSGRMISLVNPVCSTKKC